MENEFSKPVLWWNGDEADIRSELELPASTRLRWNKTTIKKFPTSFVNAYQPATAITVSKENFESFPEMKYENKIKKGEV